MIAAKHGIERFIKYYNYERPQQALGYKTPSELYLEKETFKREGQH